MIFQAGVSEHGLVAYTPDAGRLSYGCEDTLSVICLFSTFRIAP
jgi:hypothetical protein